MVFAFFCAATSCGALVVGTLVFRELSQVFNALTALPFAINARGPAATVAALFGAPVAVSVRRVRNGDQTYIARPGVGVAVRKSRKLAAMYAFEPSPVKAAATAPGRMKVCSVLLAESKIKRRCDGTSSWNLTLEIITFVPSGETARITPTGSASSGVTVLVFGSIDTSPELVST